MPYECRKSLRAMYKIASRLNELKPITNIVQLGDLYDLFALSKYPHTLNKETPKQEIIRGRQAAERMWQELQSLFPTAKCWQLKGNHCLRAQKRITEKLPELSEIVGIDHLWEFEGVKTMKSQRDELILKCSGKEIVFIHGHYCKQGQHLAHNLENTVFGHTHRAWVQYRKQKDKILWEMTTGCMADIKSHAMEYTAQKKFNSMINGFGLIDEYGARFIPLEIT